MNEKEKSEDSWHTQNSSSEHVIPGPPPGQLRSTRDLSVPKELPRERVVSRAVIRKQLI